MKTAMPNYDQLIILLTRMVAFLVILVALMAFKDEPVTPQFETANFEIDDYTLFADCNNFEDRPI